MRERTRAFILAIDAGRPGTARNRLVAAALLAAAVLATAVALLVRFPADRKLTLFGLYTIPSLLFSLPFHHEILLLYNAKYYSALVVTAVATAGTMISCFFDYGFIEPMIGHRMLRKRYEDNRVYRYALAFFRKSPFWLLVMAAYTPIPLAPFKLLAITGGYPFGRYLGAMFVGRVPRYYTLAWLGMLFPVPNWILLALGSVITTIYFATMLRRRFSARRLAADIPIDIDAVSIPGEPDRRNGRRTTVRRRRRGPRRFEWER
jgi:membrane protein YqaA with SNARE-associated domain